MKSWLHLAVCAALLGSKVALAQGDTISQPDREVERGRSAGAVARARLAAADEAALFVPLAGARVSYEDVLASPDDVELSFRYALGQVEDNELTAAAATLERILLLRPDFMRVRLLYGAVLFRLGSYAEAEQELVRVSAAPGAERHQAQIDAYLKRIRRERKTSRTTLALTGGLQHDSNRNSGPDSNQILIGGARFGLPGDDRKSADSGWFSLADLHVERELGSQENRQLLAGVSYFHQEQHDFESFDVQALHFELGLRRRRSEGDVQTKLISDVVDLSRESYLRSTGLELSALRMLAANLELRASGRVVHEDFDGIPETTGASSRSGYRSNLGAQLSAALSTSQRVGLGFGVVRKSAKESHQSFLGWGVNVSHQWLLPRGSFAITQLSADCEKYRDDEDLISSSERRDLRSRARLTLGTPVASWIGGGRFRALRGWIVSASGEVLLADSNLPNYAFRNRHVGLTLSRSFDF